ncbi:hypothetical protein [Streptomyces sp. NPDC046385]|uniref:hypothetical protein n=1 Tax=Streptomyces sp. NPDC046385 TaxID=3154918 RepID=UPI0033E0F1F9
MADTAPHTTRDPRAEHPCPACGQPRGVLARRHKVLGAWVPEWEVQPCRNPRCERYEPEPAGGDPGAGTGAVTGAATGTPTVSGTASGTLRAPVAGHGAEAASTHVTGKNGESGETGRSPAPG